MDDSWFWYAMFLLVTGVVGGLVMYPSGRQVRSNRKYALTALSVVLMFGLAGWAGFSGEAFAMEPEFFNRVARVSGLLEAPHEIVEEAVAVYTPQFATDPTAVEAGAFVAALRTGLRPVGWSAVVVSTSNDIVALAWESATSTHHPSTYINHVLGSESGVLMVIGIAVGLGLFAGLLVFWLPEGIAMFAMLLLTAGVQSLGIPGLPFAFAAGFLKPGSDEHGTKLETAGMFVTLTVTVLAVASPAMGNPQVAFFGGVYGLIMRAWNVLLPCMVLGLLFGLLLQNRWWFTQFVAFAVFSGPALGVTAIVAMAQMASAHYDAAAFVGGEAISLTLVYGIGTLIFSAVVGSKAPYLWATESSDHD